MVRQKIRHNKLPEGIEPYCLARNLAISCIRLRSERGRDKYQYYQLYSSVFKMLNNIYKNPNGYDLAILLFGDKEKVVLFIFNS